VKTNPPLKVAVGMRGSLDGRPVEVVSRVLMSNVEGGKTYYWDEWELRDAEGRVRSLEYDDGQWKLVERFEPAAPLPAEDLPMLGRGVALPLGEPAPRVTLVSRATVQAIEGRPTYEAEVGDEADYLDAKGDDGVLYSVEWADGVVECYRGRAIRQAEVRVMFPQL
jgi:hypothetical protein